jgi:hypothetical protein
MSYNPQVSPDGKVLRAAATSLGATFDSTDVITYRMQNMNQLMLYCTVAAFDATSVEIKPQVALTAGDTAPASGDWFDLPRLDTPVTSGTDAITPVRSDIYQMLGNGQLCIPIPACYKWVRAIGRRTGGTVATTLAITAMQGMA